eukprot:TRINITY_DN3845_c0_g1_i2.p1 TRINITY_DN3845_c0_g1~~TRINITY_DN3845_c0_g1_i2.p1  ORF type:complete len:1312 (+),score=272.96 TRINITY_DN3845_c0_g1_i2:71-4006(+)
MASKIAASKKPGRIEVSGKNNDNGLSYVCLNHVDAKIREPFKDLFNKDGGVVMYFFGLVMKVSENVFTPVERICFVSHNAVFLCTKEAGGKRCLLVQDITLLIENEEWVGIKVRSPSEYDMLLQFTSIDNSKKFIKVVATLYKEIQKSDLIVKEESKSSIRPMLTLTRPSSFQFRQQPMVLKKELWRAQNRRRNKQSKSVSFSPESPLNVETLADDSTVGLIGRAPPETDSPMHAPLSSVDNIPTEPMTDGHMVIQKYNIGDTLQLRRSTHWESCTVVKIDGKSYVVQNEKKELKQVDFQEADKMLRMPIWEGNAEVGSGVAEADLSMEKYTSNGAVLPVLNELQTREDDGYDEIDRMLHDKMILVKDVQADGCVVKKGTIATIIATPGDEPGTVALLEVDDVTLISVKPDEAIVYEEPIDDPHPNPHPDVTQQQQQPELRTIPEVTPFVPPEVSPRSEAVSKSADEAVDAYTLQKRKMKERELAQKQKRDGIQSPSESPPKKQPHQQQQRQQQQQQQQHDGKSPPRPVETSSVRRNRDVDVVRNQPQMSTQQPTAASDYRGAQTMDSPLGVSPEPLSRFKDDVSPPPPPPPPPPLHTPQHEPVQMSSTPSAVSVLDSKIDLMQQEDTSDSSYPRALPSMEVATDRHPTNASINGGVLGGGTSGLPIYKDPYEGEYEDYDDEPQSPTGHQSPTFESHTQAVGTSPMRDTEDQIQKMLSTKDFSELGSFVSSLCSEYRRQVSDLHEELQAHKRGERSYQPVPTPVVGTSEEVANELLVKGQTIDFLKGRIAQLEARDIPDAYLSDDALRRRVAELEEQVLNLEIANESKKTDILLLREANVTAERRADLAESLLSQQQQQQSKEGEHHARIIDMTPSELHFFLKDILNLSERSIQALAGLSGTELMQMSSSEISNILEDKVDYATLLGATRMRSRSKETTRSQSPQLPPSGDGDNITKVAWILSSRSKMVEDVWRGYEMVKTARSQLSTTQRKARRSHSPPPATDIDDTLHDAQTLFKGIVTNYFMDFEKLHLGVVGHHRPRGRSLSPKHAGDFKNTLHLSQAEHRLLSRLTSNLYKASHVKVKGPDGRVYSAATPPFLSPSRSPTRDRSVSKSRSPELAASVPAPEERIMYLTPPANYPSASNPVSSVIDAHTSTSTTFSSAGLTRTTNSVQTSSAQPPLRKRSPHHHPSRIRRHSPISSQSRSLPTPAPIVAFGRSALPRPGSPLRRTGSTGSRRGSSGYSSSGTEDVRKKATTRHIVSPLGSRKTNGGTRPKRRAQSPSAGSSACESVPLSGWGTESNIIHPFFPVSRS